MYAIAIAFVSLLAGEPVSRPAVSAGVDVSNAYFFRGILQEDEGVVVEPWAQIEFTLFEREEGLRTLFLDVGQWNSLHSGPTGSGGDHTGPAAWYESDFFAGLSSDLGEGFVARAGYTLYASPNDSFPDVHEMGASLSFDDGSHWGEGAFLGLRPSALIAFELDGQADGGSDEGAYAEVGINPGFAVAGAEGRPVTLSFPVGVGLSLHDDYEDADGDDTTLGNVNAGASLGVPLTFLPESAGEWTLALSLRALFLNDALEEKNGGDGLEWIATAGLSISF